VSRQSGLTEIYAVPAHRYALSMQQRMLPPSLRETSVGADDAMPRQLLVRGGQHAADEARRVGVDVPIGTDESLRNLAHTGDDSRNARVFGVRAGVGMPVSRAQRQERRSECAEPVPGPADGLDRVFAELRA
jgi:hypothetical protein